MKYSYATEKLSAARRALMLPHPEGEAQSIAHAFHECSLGLQDIRVDDLDSDSAQSWVAKIRELMDTSGIEDQSGRGTWFSKADQLTVNEKLELSRVVDELAHWFEKKFWGND